MQPYGRLVKRVLKSFKSKRRPQLLEVYCRLFYKDHVLPHVKVEVDRLTLLNGKKPTRGQRLRLVRDFAAKYFDKEPEEIKDQVVEVYEKCKEEVDKEDEEATKSPQAYAAYVAWCSYTSNVRLCSHLVQFLPYPPSSMNSVTFSAA